MPEEIKTYWKITGPDGYYLTDGYGDDLIFDSKKDAEDYIVGNGWKLEDYEIEEFSNVDRVKAERFGQY